MIVTNLWAFIFRDFLPTTSQQSDFLSAGVRRCLVPNNLFMKHTWYKYDLWHGDLPPGWVYFSSCQVGLKLHGRGYRAELLQQLHVAQHLAPEQHKEFPTVFNNSHWEDVEFSFLCDICVSSWFIRVYSRMRSQFIHWRQNVSVFSVNLWLKLLLRNIELMYYLSVFPCT